MLKYPVFLVLICVVLLNSPLVAKPVEKNVPIVKEYPWFKESFLDLPEDLAAAKENGRGLILYFHQEGCPYCKKLLNDNFSRPELVKKLTANYDFLEINMWGDKEVVGIDGSELTEKTLAQKLKVMFTPTLVFLNASGQVEFRLNGYYSPQKFNTLLDYLASERAMPFSQYYRQLAKKTQQKQLQKDYFIQTTQDYAAFYQGSNKPILILLEEDNCKECDELHQNLSSSENFKKIIEHFNITRLNIHSDKVISNINGQKMSASTWAESLKVQYTPTLLFYAKEEKGSANKVKETFRLASYVRKFHLESVLLYIAKKKYLEYPEFQRYIHARTTELREKGIKFDLWK